LFIAVKLKAGCTIAQLPVAAAMKLKSGLIFRNFNDYNKNNICRCFIWLLLWN